MVLSAVVAASCSLKKLTVNQTADILADAGRAFDREVDPELAAAAIPASLKTMEGFLEAHPEQPILLRLLADGYMAYAFGFLEDEAERVAERDPGRAEALRQRAFHLYMRARGFGLRLLALDHPELARRLADGGEPDEANLAAIDPETLPGLFWTANPWGAAINVAKSDPEMLSHLPVVKRLMERCAAIDAGYYWAGPLLALGAMEAGLPKALGGKPDRAKDYFGRAMALTGGKHLMTRVIYGRAVGVQTADRKLYVQTMSDVLEVSPDIEPRLALANRLAQRRALRYVKEADALFLGEE